MAGQARSQGARAPSAAAASGASSDTIVLVAARLRLWPLLHERDALALVLEAELGVAAVLALIFAGRRARQRTHRHADRAASRGHRGRDLGARAHVVPPRSGR